MSVTFFIAGQGRPEDCCCIPYDQDCTHCGKDRFTCECFNGPGCPCDPCNNRPQLNLANANARDLLFSLGYFDEDLCGQARVSELRPRIEHAIKVIEQVGGDGPRPVVRTGNVIDCGRRHGYLTEKLRLLLNLCDQAGALGRINWA